MNTFKVIDNQTGKAPDLEQICLKETWAKNLCYCDVGEFALTEEGLLLLLDECGNFAYCPLDRFTIIYEAPTTTIPQTDTGQLNPDYAILKTWEEFKAAKLLWFVNTFLHLFGWALVMMCDDSTNKVLKVFPAQVKFRGFDEETNRLGYIGLTEHIIESINRLTNDINNIPKR